jgi:hypothetical protein
VPVAVAVPIVGAPGTIASTLEVLFELALTAPNAFVAVTTHRIVLPASAATKTYVVPVAEPIFDSDLCH